MYILHTPFGHAVVVVDVAVASRCREVVNEHSFNPIYEQFTSARTYNTSSGCSIVGTNYVVFSVQQCQMREMTVAECSAEIDTQIDVVVNFNALMQQSVYMIAH